MVVVEVAIDSRPKRELRARSAEVGDLFLHPPKSYAFPCVPTYHNDFSLYHGKYL